MPSNHLILCRPLLLLQSFPASESLPVSWFFTSGGQSIGVSASSSVLPMNIQNWFPFGLTDFLSHSPRDSQESSATPQFKGINSLAFSFLYIPNCHIHTWLLEKPLTLTRWNFVSKVTSMLFNVLFRMVIAFFFFPRSKLLFISWLQSLSAVILEPQKIKSVTVSIVSPSTYHEVIGPDAMLLVFECFILY